MSSFSRTLQVAFVLTTSTLAIPASTHADIIFSTFGPGNSFSSGTGYTISGSATIPGADSQGLAFTPSVTESLSEIDVAFFKAGGSGLFNLELHNDSAGTVGSLIEAYTNLGPAPSPAAILPPIFSTLHPTLVAGTPYWLIGTPADTGSWTAWDQSSPPVNGSIYQNQNGNVTYSSNLVLPAVRLSGISPEPSSLALVAIGFGVAGIVRLRQRTVRRVR